MVTNLIKDDNARNSQSSLASQDSIELVLNQFEFTHSFDKFRCSKTDDNSNRVGDGAFSSVGKYEHKDLGEVVIKKLRIKDNGHGIEGKSTVGSFLREVKALQRLSHENIVQFHGTTRVSENVVGIVMEYVDGTSLQCLLKKQGSKLPWIVRLWILYQISKALKQLHRYKKDKWLVHSDLKSQNILITDDWKVKVIDFGSINFGKDSAASVDSLDHLKSGQKTDFYAAPEILVVGDVERTRDEDIYSFAMVIYEVLTGKEVYSDATCTHDCIIVAIKSGERPNPVNLDEIENLLKESNEKDAQGIFGNLRSLTEQCWEQDPRNRPTIEEVIERLEETFQNITGERLDDFELQIRVDQATLSVELEVSISCLENSETISEDSFAGLVRKISTSPELDDRVYDMIDDVAILFMKLAEHSRLVQDVQKAFELWSNVPDLEKAKQGVEKCMDHLKKSNTKFTLQVETREQTVQKAIADRLRASNSQLTFPNDTAENETLPVCASSCAVNESVILIEQPEDQCQTNVHQRKGPGSPTICNAFLKEIADRRNFYLQKIDRAIDRRLESSKTFCICFSVLVFLYYAGMLAFLCWIARFIFVFLISVFYMLHLQINDVSSPSTLTLLGILFIVSIFEFSIVVRDIGIVVLKILRQCHCLEYHCNSRTRVLRLPLKKFKIVFFTLTSRGEENYNA